MSCSSNFSPEGQTQTEVDLTHNLYILDTAKNELTSKPLNLQVSEILSIFHFASYWMVPNIERNNVDIIYLLSCKHFNLCAKTNNLSHLF